MKKQKSKARKKKSKSIRAKKRVEAKLTLDDVVRILDTSEVIDIYGCIVTTTGYTGCFGGCYT